MSCNKSTAFLKGVRDFYSGNHYIKPTYSTNSDAMIRKAFVMTGNSIRESLNSYGKTTRK
jgi:hypothetical protein